MTSPSEPPRLTLDELRQFTGAETYFRYSLNPRCVYTEGVQFVAERAGAYWLLDEILLAQIDAYRLRLPEFQVWRLTVHENFAATLEASNGNDVVVYTKAISWTDFPMRSIELWFANNTLYLPSEH